MTDLSRVRNYVMSEPREKLRVLKSSIASAKPERIWRGKRSVQKVLRLAAAALALVSLTTAGARSQEDPPAGPNAMQSPNGTLKGGVTYTDQSSDTCEQQNANNPYAGMNPLVCYGVMFPADSRGECSLQGMTVLKKEGNECYFCSPITSPPSIIIPMDQVGAAESQGWGCGLDQADACMVICHGGKTYSPIPGSVVKGGGPGLPPTPAPTQGGPPPGYAPMPGPAGGIGYTPGANPCAPFGPGGYDYCNNGPSARLPAGCVCSKSTPAPPATKPTTTNKQPSNPIVDTGQYIQGFVDGIGACVQGIGNLFAGAGYFMTGNFVKAQELLGLSPGQSIILKTLYAEMTTPQINVISNNSPYQVGLTGGRRLCAYGAVPGLTKAAGTALKGGIPKGGGGTPTPKGGSTGGGTGGSGPGEPTPSGPGEPGAGGQGNPGGGGGGGPPGNGSTGGNTNGSVTQPGQGGGPSSGSSTGTQPGVPTGEPTPQIPPGEGLSAANPVQGGPLQASIDSAPTNLANKWVQLGSGPAKFGGFVGKGSFADVFKYETGKVIKVSRDTPDILGYGPESIKGQMTGAQRLGAVKVETPETSNYQPGGNGTPASMVADDVAAKYPGSFQLTGALFRKMPPAVQQQVLSAINQANGKIAGGGYGWADTNPSNITLLKVGSAFKVIIHDPDMIMTQSEIEAALQQGSVPGGVILAGLKRAGQSLPTGSYSIQTLSNILNTARTNWLYGANKPPVQ